tara:strand:- start:424 stop:579 length:156 start_codon:yes stop_codon:yes gene_type:complete
MKELMALSGLNREEIEDAVKSGSLSKPLPLGPWSVGWDEKIIKKWIANEKN